ncbi:STAS domain-containing protein [Legionella hackeliae]|uniref:Putative anti-sigma-B factor antagonist (Anti-anti-sigma-B factor) n=1 Tax=Legionella hackeliae TaxID=449 RepID=A0A0A8UUG0_LEGHA|nr:STAS domain-containing protein [Legionella hackeliae]KTD09562.1 putative anti-sigma-B factor antagonist (Anti-anti-sigma-B factor) [Legionella hackeliae]CEK11121.1 putative anti-sigma-B factor antagonist (Anti-anti-sigma-B factor) [Legionella hackeliae]STX47873.1 putative anti-sigma-B factor antagonist (Anti-anti-sigma-B factor) [Legionella hackeliae]
MKINAFKPSSEMTFSTVQVDRERLVKYVRETTGDVIKLDLSEVTHCDSAGLALLIEAKRLSTQRSKVCQVEDMPKAVHALAEFCGVDGILNKNEINPM